MVRRIVRVGAIAVAALVGVAMTSSTSPGTAPPAPADGATASIEVAPGSARAAATAAVPPAGRATADEAELEDTQAGAAVRFDGDGLLSFSSARIQDRIVERSPAPVGLRIGALDVAAPVVPARAGGDGAMAVPDGVDEVAWYEFGPSPGEPGSAVLAAHVDMAGLGPGVFFELHTLAPGDVVTVTFADGAARDFEVIESNRYRKEELDTARIFDRTGSATLTLVTCGGGFNPALGRYDSNVVVRAAPLTSGRAS